MSNNSDPRRSTVGLERARVLTIIVNFNMGQLLERCLSSLQRSNDGDFSHHIIVWENGSERSICDHPIGSQWALTSSTVWYIGAEGNFGYARGINEAYRRWRQRAGATPMAVHCCNPDTVSDPDAVARLVGTLRRRAWGAVGPIATFDDGSSRPAAYPPLTPLLVVAHFLRLKWMRRFGRRLQPAAEPQEVPGAIDGSFIVFDGRAWEQISGLDDDFGISSDDHDVCNRVRKAGWKVGIDPSSRISHNGAASRSETPLLSRLDEVQGSVRYISKYYPRSLGWVRLAMWGLLRFRKEPLSKELAWWARRAPVSIESHTPNLQENYAQALRSLQHRTGRILASRLESEWLHLAEAAQSQIEP